MVQTHQQGDDKLGACITVSRNRLKSYGSVIYMKSGAHYEIELWNLKTTRVLANISIDGSLISSSGIVLNPGQRVYLERWIDAPKKFKFSTYEVENTPQAKEAIQHNGLVQVNFHDETVKNYFPSWNSNEPYYKYMMSYGGTTVNNLYTTGTGSNSTFNLTTNPSSFNTTFNLTSSNSNLSSGITSDTFLNETSKGSLETGRSEAGESSSQKLDSTTGDFNVWTSKMLSFQLLPESAKPVEADKIRSYCTECGTRVRSSSWKFCPACGEKL
jgi:hypothetical protein